MAASEPGCVCVDGWICEQHPDQPWPHGDCPGPGVPCERCQPPVGRPLLPEDWDPIASTDDERES
jgi:hypothetical protein